MPGNVEHERKFVVRDPAFVRHLMASDDSNGGHFVQGYLVDRQGVSLRVRLADSTGFLTFKGPRHGARRVEHEQEIPAEMAELLLQVCEGGLIRKVRFPVLEAGLHWEVDVFFEGNEGLVIAELEDPPEDLVPPAWCGPDVTEDDRFYNQRLVQAPFATWPDREEWQLDWA